MFLEQCKCVVKEKKIPEYINDKIEISSDNSNREDSDEKNSDKANCNEEKLSIECV